MKWIIPELRVLALTKGHVGSGNEIAIMGVDMKVEFTSCRYLRNVTCCDMLCFTTREQTLARVPRTGKLRSSPVPLPDLYFDSFSYPVAPIVSSAGAIV